MDMATDRWAEGAGIQVIRYKNNSLQHEELHDILRGLMAYVPIEEDVVPFAPSGTYGVSVALPEPDELEILDRQIIREKLNTAAAAILNGDEADRYERYEAFRKKYEAAIHRAWYVTTEPPRNRLLQYELIEEIGAGAFGTIFRASDGDGKPVAVKLLHDRIMRDHERLQGFRRGVRSMRILSRENVDGVVPYVDAAEIPALAVMEFIEGENLRAAVEQNGLSDWSSVLRVAAELVRIIRSAHQLPQHVLHRDIRPANIMLKDYWQGSESWKVVVLDFDLSWHRDAEEVSISNAETMNGFLAPELLNRDLKMPTRNALVDSYGLGMTFYFMRTGRVPLVAQSAHRDWGPHLRDLAAQYGCSGWRSLARRFFRLIDHSTRPKQSERWDVGQILAELERLEDAYGRSAEVQSAELWAEELIARADTPGYEWSGDDMKASVRIGGLIVELIAKEVERCVEFRLSWQQQGGEHYADVRRWLPKVQDQVRASLVKSGWLEIASVAGSYQFESVAHVPVEIIGKNQGQLVAGLREAVNKAQFTG
jgi:eukaryotic-like serine/threonine-protein kinase